MGKLTTQELLKRVRHIEIRIRGMVNEVFAGEYHSVFKGRGMEFAEVREYLPGDDIRNIDWNVSARMNRPFVKVFEEERELTTVILFDTSASQRFGTRNQFKEEMGIEIAALLASSALKNNDKVGLLVFDDAIRTFIPPRKGRHHILRIIRELIYSLESTSGRGTNLQAALQYVNQLLKRKATIFMISDFLTRGFERDLQVISRKHDVVSIRVYDPMETHLPENGLWVLEDAESGEWQIVDLSDAAVRNQFQHAMQQHWKQLTQFFRSIKLDFVEVNTREGYMQPLTRFFKMRARRFH